MNKVEYFTDLAKSIEKDERRMGDDLISRQAAICAIEEYADRLQMVNWEKNPGVPYKAHALNWAINTLRDLPSAQPERGKWIKIHWKAFRCSVCSKVSEYNTNFCPECGADMRGKQDDQ